MGRNIGNRDTNKLFPIFLKLENLAVLIVGGGKIGLEKINAILGNDPFSDIKLVGIKISEEIKGLSLVHHNIKLAERIFLPADVEGRDIVIVAINDHHESARIRTIAKQKAKLVNVADQPGLCDFYMSSIVQKGNLKIAISTNGKSPTIAKKLKELLNELLPGELDSILDNMHRIRSGLKGDFKEKVNQLNMLTKNFLIDKEELIEPLE